LQLELGCTAAAVETSEVGLLMLRNCDSNENQMSETADTLTGELNETPK